MGYDIVTVICVGIKIYKIGWGGGRSVGRGVYVNMGLSDSRELCGY